MTKPLFDVLQRKTPETRPLWIMRQAGRYLPEYREIRAKAKNFLNMCLTPDYATEVTLQPIRRFGMDGAILFADILLIPMALGRGLEFKEGEGPQLDPIKTEADINNLRFNTEKLLPIYETVKRVKADLPKKTTMIGFCGAPWTVACYMVDGNSRNDFSAIKKMAQEAPDLLQKLINTLIDASVYYLGEQIKAGAEVVQVFDSWSGLLQGEDFRRFVIKPTEAMVKKLKEQYPSTPIIGFPREAGNGYAAYAKESGVDVVGLDQSVNLDFAKTELQPLKILQGNLDPQLLITGGQAMKDGLKKIMDTFGPKHIVNLGHGITPETPIAHVTEMVEFVHGYPCKGTPV